MKATPKATGTGTTPTAVSIRSARAHELYADAPPDELQRVERRVAAMEDGARRAAKRGRAYVVDDDLEKRATYMVLVALAGPAGGVALLPGLDPLVRWGVLAASLGAASWLIAFVARRTTAPLPIAVVGRVVEMRAAERVVRVRYVIDDLERATEAHVDDDVAAKLATGALCGVLVDPRRPGEGAPFVVEE